ncbi:MAG: coenzyme F420-0:L-glutamate ligase [Dehalococcoidales bacterium]|nr:coenzyme F420-0:L-glutamate ligase [Dehalococcoidales bacterium]
MKKLEVMGLTSLPEINPGDRMAKIIVKSATDEAGGIRDKDIIVVTEKVLSKAAGRVVSLDGVRPGKEALAISKKTGEPAALLQLILENPEQRIIAVVPVLELARKYRPAFINEETMSILHTSPAILLTMDRQGRIYNEAGIDTSNHPEGVASLALEDPDSAARELRQEIKEMTGKEIAVLIADTLPVIPFGSLDIPMGSSGIEPVSQKFGRKDRFGKPKFGGVDNIAFELTAAAALLLGQSDEGIPVAIIRGLDYPASEVDNIRKMLVPLPRLMEMLRVTLKATAGISGFKRRLALKLLRWSL